MGSLNLAIKDIKRQKQRSLLFIVVQACITASGMIVYGLSLAIQAQIGQTKAYFNNSIIQIFNDHLTFLFNFALVAGIAVAVILSCLLTVARMNDLAILLALGGTFKQIQRVPLAQIFVITLIAGVIGWIGGIVGLSIFLLLLQFTTVNALEVLNFPFGISYIAVQIIGTYVFAGFIVNMLLKKRFREIIDGQYDVVQVDSDKFWGIKLSMKNRIGFRLAYLFSKRSRILNWVMITGTFMLIFLTTFGILGGNIIQETTNSYISRGYGSNVYVVTPKEISPVLRELYDPEVELQFDASVINSENVVPTSFFDQLVGNYVFEPRLLLSGVAKMIVAKAYVPSEGWPEGGGNRTLETFYWGVESSFSLFDYYGVGIASPTSDTVQIGDGMIRSYFDEQILHSIIPAGDVEETKRYKVNGVIMDPFARGYSVFMDSQELAYLRNLPDPNAKNVVFIADPDEQIFTLIQNFEQLDYFSLDIYKEKYMGVSNSFWIISTIAFIPAMVSAGLSLVAYSGLIARIILNKDLKILHALGGNQKTLMRVIVWVNLLLVVYAAPLAVFVGFASAYSFLITDPYFPSIQAWLVLGIEFLIMALIIYRYLHYLFREFYGGF